MTNNDQTVISVNVNRDLYGLDRLNDFKNDCPNDDYIPATLPAVKRIIAIGDIHGDLKLAIESFKLANLIDDNFNWIANPPNTIVVQVGDQVDSCRPSNGKNCNEIINDDDVANDVDVLELFNSLHDKAKKHGGAVYSLLGNHELMNSQGDFRYVSKQNYHNYKYAGTTKEYTGPIGRNDSFRPGGDIANKLACTRVSVLIIGTNMFVHAGVLPGLVSKLEYLGLDNHTKLEHLNKVVRKWLLGKMQLSESNKETILNGQFDSPFWTRIYGSIPENTNLNEGHCVEYVKKTLEVFKIGQIIVGHTPQRSTNSNSINGTCYEKDTNTNRLYRIDGGFSKAFNSFGLSKMIQVLEIIDDNKFNIIKRTI